MPERAADVAAPPYDVLSTDEASARAAGKPWSFLHISRPEIDLPPGTNAYAPQVYAKATREPAAHARGAHSGARRRAVLLRLSHHLRKAIRRPDWCALLLSRSTTPTASASTSTPTGQGRRSCAADRSVECADRSGADRVSARPGRRSHCSRSLPAGTPVADVTADDNVRHSVWPIRSPDAIAALSAQFDAHVRLVYRGRASSLGSSLARRCGSARAGSAVAYAGARVFSRGVLSRIINCRSCPTTASSPTSTACRPTHFCSGSASGFNVEAAEHRSLRTARGEFGLYLAGRWYRLFIHAGLIPVTIRWRAWT